MRKRVDSGRCPLRHLTASTGRLSARADIDLGDNTCGLRLADDAQAGGILILPVLRKLRCAVKL
ncbi:hypothetical protein AB0M57_29915 [Streptomyces sp. NPDC051597]|uniref:hypothetical protein n=1 Tax=Streptomyces sp. NPDC051597 TaxID=3155049 RepID=UPI00342B6696